MGIETAIAWTHHTFNIAWGCQKVSPGCAHCYAETIATRRGRTIWGPGADRLTFGPEHWNEPRRWDRVAARAGMPSLVFCSSMCDIGEDHATIIGEVARLWPLIRSTPWLVWQLLTKRSERFSQILPNDWRRGYRNVWLGVSVESMAYAHRVDALRQIPARLRFVSYEPALGPLDDLNLAGIGWVIYGGESGPGFRAHDLAWPRAMREKCRTFGVPFFYKQSPAHRTEMGITLDGEIVREFPTIATERPPASPRLLFS